MRRIVYVTGTRADFGLMQRTLMAIHHDPRLDLGVCVTGTHLLPAYGETVREIEGSGLKIIARLPVALDGSSGATMATALAVQLDGMTRLFSGYRPDLVLVLGDRGEMLAGALAALHLNIPIAHIHGGELSGTVDEPVRHAISKLSHYHFTSTEGARQRLIRMGERADRVFVSGAPGLDGLTDSVAADRAALCGRFGFDPSRPVALMVFHPVLQEVDTAGPQTRALLDALQERGCQTICLLPNSDAGGAAVRAEIEARASVTGCAVLTHLPRDEYLACLASADMLVGNSSSGIIEAASFGLPVVNVGCRQHGREQSSNVIDSGPTRAEIVEALAAALKRGRQPCENVYGDGQAGRRIVEWLATLPLDAQLMNKQNAY